MTRISKIQQNPRQKTLPFDKEQQFHNLKIKNGQVGFNDPAFYLNKSEPIHRWVPWIAGFSKTFVSDVLCKNLTRSGTVLDPFSGVGTTLVEALLSGKESIGFEINPYAALACRVKLSALQISTRKLEEVIDCYSDFYQSRIASDYIPESSMPEGFKTRGEFYSPAVLHKVLITLDFIKTIADGLIKNVFRIAFASTMISYSNYSYEPSLGRRVSAGKENIIDFDVNVAIVRKLLDIRDDVEYIKKIKGNPQKRSRIICDSFFNWDNYSLENSIDLVITSPPYLNNYHYNRNTRPQLYWLNLVKKPNDLKPLEQSNFGKFWQTVRTDERIELNFTSPAIEESIELIRNMNPEKGVYGGNGWANYAACYFNDCFRLARGLKLVLKKGRSAFIVIGNSIIQGVAIPTDQFLGKIAEKAGLELVSIDIPRLTRNGNSIIQSSVRVGKAEKKESLYEAIVELRNR